MATLKSRIKRRRAAVDIAVGFRGVLQDDCPFSQLAWIVFFGEESMQVVTQPRPEEGQSRGVNSWRRCSRGCKMLTFSPRARERKVVKVCREKLGEWRGADSSLPPRLPLA